MEKKILWNKCLEKPAFGKYHIKGRNLESNWSASKGIQTGLYWKITWPPLIFTYALKIVLLVVQIYSAGFVKCFDYIAVFCSFWISPVNCKSKKNKIYCCIFILQSLKIFASDTGLSELWINVPITILHQTYMYGEIRGSACTFISLMLWLNGTTA